MKKKVYVVTRGDYSDYGIEKIFTTRDAAEKYCAIDTDIWDTPMIEEWDVEDGSDIQIDKIYKAVKCHVLKSGKLNIDETLYGTSPFVLSHKHVAHYNYDSYIVPINRDVEDDEHIMKIVYDSIAKYKAEQNGL